MPKNKAFETSERVSIEEAWKNGDEVGLLHAVVTKYARVLDMTDSGRDIKPLVTGMFEAIDRYKATVGDEGSNTADADINRKYAAMRERMRVA